MTRGKDEPLLRIHSLIPGARIYRRFLLECTQKALHHFQKPVASIDFIVISSRKMTALHRRYLHQKGATDVMAFDLSDNGAPIEGEVYICLEKARSQAKSYGVTLASEFARLAVHGLLHLAGEKDSTEAGRNRMRHLETQAIQKVERAN